VKFIPRHNQIIGRNVMRKVLSAIVRPDDTRNTTKFVLIDAVGTSVRQAGLKPGDVVLSNTLSLIQMDGGISVRPILAEENVVAIVVDVEPGDLWVQNENGTRYVPLDSPEAAPPLGVEPDGRTLAQPQPQPAAGIA